ncbi:MAG: cyclic pyranopterin monophosphate synthase MoaC [Synergistetes bacterium]|nr:cyclic pyranopterin monophosphate synthase MoaC [Synergistota bacterium]
MSGLTHVKEDGSANMVDVSGKAITHREAMAECKVVVGEPLYSMILENTLKKGDVIGVSRIAGIMGGKKTAELIPLCHPIRITKIDVDIQPLPGEKALRIVSTAKADDKTGVEMEALTAVSIAALAVYDMCKAVSKDVEITGIRLLKKSGGKSGTYIRGDL